MPDPVTVTCVACKGHRKVLVDGTRLMWCPICVNENATRAQKDRNAQPVLK